MRNSKAYGGFKTFNGLLFIVLGVLIIVQLAVRIGLRIEALSGFLLGGAMIALGVYRAVVFRRRSRT